MFERYTEAARRVVFYSRYLATQGGSQTIGTEHLLLGLLRADMALARRFLGSPWAAEEIWRDVERKNSLRRPHLFRAQKTPTDRPNPCRWAS
jgi:ATP-dependent Clp protease ATP-binding subunit ClpC